MSRHALPIRGLDSARRSPSFEGRFGRLFQFAGHATFGLNDAESEENLRILAESMSAEPDEPQDGRDDEESGIPALYTYFGQFIDHDLTFDPASSLQKRSDPDALVDYRTPAFDLDNVYGRGPDDQPYLYDENGLFILGDELRGGGARAQDLQRNRAVPARALIGDPRNDENVIVSQLHGLFLRFHNRFRGEHPLLSFAEVQQQVRFHYQYVILHDFLPRLICPSVLQTLRAGGKFDEQLLQFYHFRNYPFMPVEFSVAAYRLGHSMVRPGYRLNDDVLLPIFPFGEAREGLTGFRAMNPAWGIDWARFIDLELRDDDGDDLAKRRRLQFAYRIDTSLVHPLANLPAAVVQDRPPSLAHRNLVRGLRLGLPSGQTIAKRIGERPLSDEQIELAAAPATPTLASLDNRAFIRNCPLWTYILAEAMHHRRSVDIPVNGQVRVDTPQLGPVGGRIVAETFLGLMFGNHNSLLRTDPYWHPQQGRHYHLKDFVSYALGG